ALSRGPRLSALPAPPGPPLLRLRAGGGPGARSGWLGKFRLRAADLARRGRGVGAPGDPSEDEQPDPVGPRPDLALRRRSDPGDVIGVERHPLAVDLELTAAFEGQEDLLLVIVGVVVAGVAAEGWRQVDHLHAERLDAELGPGPLEGAVERRVHFVDPVYRVIPHTSPFPGPNGRAFLSCRGGQRNQGRTNARGEPRPRRRSGDRRGARGADDRAPRLPPGGEDGGPLRPS